KSYGHARIANDGSVTLRGDWTGLRLPGASGPVMSNGKAATASIKAGVLLFGKPPTVLEDRAERPLPEVPMDVKPTPAVLRVSTRARRTMTFTLENTLDRPLSGSLQFDLPAVLSAEPANATCRPHPPGPDAM